MNRTQNAFQKVNEILKAHGWDNPPPDPIPERVEYAEFSTNPGESPDFEHWEKLAEAWRVANLGDLKTPTEKALWEIIKVLEKAIMKQDAAAS